ncbi:MAG TPA: hypothetical protein VLE93_00790 [Candidatus Saccharimonadales bacterium]|nr:hypothetical protein [Candidatus Saccharimonadales bacterium]
MKIIDRFLNAVTMYRLTVYYLIFLLVTAIGLAMVGLLHYQPITIAINAIGAVSAGYAANWLLARLFGAATNTESALITGLIIALLVPATTAGLPVAIFASVVAMATKYFLTVEKTHIFNPAAAAIAMIGLLSPEHAATWWVGNIYLVMPVLLGGLLLQRKLNRTHLVWWFLGVYTVLVMAASLVAGHPLSFVHTLWFAATNSALFFFALVMLTEPRTLPTSRAGQNWYAGLVAVLYATPQLHFLPLSLTPELALTAGNLVSAVIKTRLQFDLQLLEKRQLTRDTWLFYFNKPVGFRFRSGQYLEWTLPHSPVDGRGNRRYFTIASSPTESSLQLLVKFPTSASSYKQTLQLMPKNHLVAAGSLFGDFVLPKNTEKKLAFIAGGVGVAPFRAFAKELVDTQTQRDVVQLFSNKRVNDIVFADLFRQAESKGLKTIYTLTDSAALPADWPGEVGLISKELVCRTIPDYRQRTFYVSGPQPMVQAAEQVLASLGLPKKQVVTDYFPGYSE